MKRGGPAVWKHRTPPPSNWVEIAPATDICLVLVLPAGTKAEADLIKTTSAVEFRTLTEDELGIWLAQQAQQACGTTIVPEAAALLVRTVVNPDALDEGDHTFTLSAENRGGTVGTGTGTIDDHGGGVKYADVAPTGPTGLTPAPVTNTTALDDDRALSIADRGYVMETGKISLEGPAEELIADPRIREAYLGL